MLARILGCVVTDEGLAAFRENGFVEGDRFYEVRMHGSALGPTAQSPRVGGPENGNRIPT